MMGRLLTISAVSVIVLGLFMYEPLPEGWQQPWKTRAILAANRVLGQLASGSEVFGYSAVNVTRYWHGVLGPYIQRTAHLAGVVTWDTHIAGIPVRVYKPPGMGESKTPAPGVIYYHGGGWTILSIESHDAFVRRLVQDLGVVAVSVEYRLAPEHPFPVPTEDSIKVTKYILTNAPQFGIEKSRVALAGDSAGGNMAAVISIKLRDDKFPIQPKLQVLLYPALQFVDLSTPSYQANKDGPAISKENVAWFLTNYFQGNSQNMEDFLSNKHVPKLVVEYLRKKYMPLDSLPDDALKSAYKPVELAKKSKLWDELEPKLTSPLASPLLVDNLKNLPFAYITVCSNDVLRDDGIWYAARLGNEGAQLDIEKCFHGWNLMIEELESANQCMNKVVTFMKKNL